MQMLQRFCFFYSGSLYNMTEAHLDGVSSRMSLKIQSLNKKIDTLLWISYRLNVLSLVKLQVQTFGETFASSLKAGCSSEMSLLTFWRTPPWQNTKELCLLKSSQGHIADMRVDFLLHSRVKPDIDTTVAHLINALRAEISQSDRFQCGNFATVLHRKCCLMLQLCNF